MISVTIHFWSIKKNNKYIRLKIWILFCTIIFIQTSPSKSKYMYMQSIYNGRPFSNNIQQQQKLLSATFIVGRREIKFIKDLKSLNPCISRIVLFTLQFQAADKINTHRRRNRWMVGSAPSHFFFLQSCKVIHNHT